MKNKIPANSFVLNKDYLDCTNIKQLECNNQPICHVYKKHGKYKYLEIDFITCDWCLSSIGQEKLQAKLNAELIFMWLRGYNLKLNYNSVGHMTILFRGDDLAINHLLHEINNLSEDNTCWQQFRYGKNMTNIKRNNGYVRAAYHVKGNTKKLKA